MRHGNAVGLDYHTTFVQVAVMDEDGRLLGSRRCDNDWQAIRQAADAHGPVGRVAIEACCGAANLAEQLVQLAGWHVELAHPGYVARMKQTPDKSDFTDAQLLADLTRVGYLPKVWLAPQALRELRSLVRYRAGLVDDRRRVKQRISAVLREQRIVNDSGAARWTIRWRSWLTSDAPLSEHGRWIVDQHLLSIESLTAKIAASEQRLETVTRDDAMVGQLLEQKGVGPVTAWVIRAEIGRFDRFCTGKQVSRFCGLSPRNASKPPLGLRHGERSDRRLGTAALTTTGLS